LTNVRRTTVAAAHWQLVTTYKTVSIAPARQVTPVMDSPVQVRLITAFKFSALLLIHNISDYYCMSIFMLVSARKVCELLPYYIKTQK